MTATAARYLSLADAAAELGISRETVRREIGAGRLIAYRFGTQYRIDRSDLEAWIAASRVEPMEPVVLAVKTPPRSRSSHRW